MFWPKKQVENALEKNSSQIRWVQAMDNLKTWHEQHECNPENIAKWQKVHDEVASWISEYAQTGNLLDVGCRRGELRNSHLFPSGVEYFGIDPLQVAEHSYNFEFRCETLELSSFGHDTFDFLVIKDSFDYFSDPEIALLYAFRILKMGGRLLISEGGHQPCDGHELTRSLLSAFKLLKRGGLRGLLSSAFRKLKREDRSADMFPLSVDVLDTYPNGDLSASYILDCCVRSGFQEVNSSIKDNRLFISAIAKEPKIRT